MLGVDCRAQGVAGGDAGFCEEGSPLDEYCTSLEALCISDDPVPEDNRTSSHPESTIAEELGKHNVNEISRTTTAIEASPARGPTWHR